MCVCDSVLLFICHQLSNHKTLISMITVNLTAQASHELPECNILSVSEIKGDILSMHHNCANCLLFVRISNSLPSL